MPDRTAREEMAGEVADTVIAFMARRAIKTLDITGGAPELNAHFRRLVTAARAHGVHVMDRCNLTILEQPGQEDLADFLATQGVEVVASMPCYLQDNVERQRGKGVFDGSIRGLRALNARGYGRDPRLALNLVYNPQGPSLPPAQGELEADYKRVLAEEYGIVFDRLFVLANMPIQRFGSALVTKGEFDGYLQLLQDAHLDANLDGVMCRNLISVDWQGYVYDCDFNQMLGLHLARGGPRARAAGRSGRRRPRRQCRPRRRPLLRLHRRARLELRRRAERGGGMNMLARALPDRAQAEQAGRNCPRDYTYAPSVFARAPDFSADTLYVVGGLYGNLPALDAVEKLAAREQAPPQIVFNGDFHWFDAEPDWFGAVERGVSGHLALRGNVETELARAEDVGAGCGCAYPETVEDGVVERSNAILAQLRAAAPEAARARLRGLPMHLVAQVGALRVGLVHGDACSLAGWRFAPDALDDRANTRWLASMRAQSQIDVFACTHTCLAALRDFALETGPADRDQQRRRRHAEFLRHPLRRHHAHRHLALPAPAALWASSATAFISTRWRSTTTPAAFLDRFLARWPQGSPAHQSYYRRIAAGPDYQIAQAAAL